MSTDDTLPPPDLAERVRALRREQPAASAAVEQYVEDLTRGGVDRRDALRRALEAVGR